MTNRRLAALALLLSLVGAPTLVLARAGGGQSYSGGSRSSSSGSRSSSSSFRSSSSSSRSSSSSSSSYHSSSSSGGYSYSYERTTKVDDTEGFVCIGLCVVINIILVAAFLQGFFGRDGKNTRREIQRRQHDRRRAPDFGPMLTKLRAADPAFEVHVFLAQMEKNFLELQEAWSTGDFSGARRFMSDGLLRRFTTQLSLNAQFGKKNVVADVSVRSRSLVAVESDRDFDTLHVAFQASLRDLDVPKDTPYADAVARAGSVRKTEFLEYWSFVRRRGATTKDALAEGKCPACGAPQSTTVTGNCEYCQAILNSGTYDWVLAEITQEDEFDVRQRPNPEGFAFARERDPGLNRQVLEDRASLVFWKLVERLASGRTDRFSRYLAPGAKVPQGPKSDFEQTAVGAVDLTAFDVSADGENAHFVVKWSTSGAGTGIVRTDVLTLQRAAGTVTNTKTGLSTERCQRCTAPQTKAEQVTCEYCGAPLTEDWCFAGLLPIDQFRARMRDGRVDRLGIAGDQWEQRRALQAMAAVVLADGTVTPAERNLLQMCAKRWGVSKGELNDILQGPKEALAELAPQTEEARLAFYTAVAAAAWIDGKVDASEQKLLDAVAAHLQLTGEQAAEAMKRARSMNA